MASHSDTVQALKQTVQKLSEINFAISSAGIWINAGTFDYTDWQPNATNQGTIDVATILQGFVITGIAVDITVGFTGTGIDQTSLGFFSSVNESEGIGSIGTVNSVIAKNLSVDSFFSQSSNYTLKARITVLGEEPSTPVINDLTAGEFELWYKIEQLS
jgi:hypothetical protein